MSLQLLGAAAGLVALTTFVGGAMLWIRFEELDLPADQAVNLLPKQLLLVVGAHALAGAVCAGAIAALLFLISPAYGSGGRRRGFPYVATIFLLLLVGSVIAAVSVQEFHFLPDQLTMLAALVLAIVGVLTIAASPAGRMHMAWALFAAFALGGAVLAVVETRGAPRMEPVAIVLDNEKSQGVGGFYIGQTTDRVYLAPLPGTGDPGDPFADADIDRVIEVKRDQVRQMAFREPTGIREDEAGREQAQTLLEDLRIVAAGGLPPGEELITTADPITAFAPLVHLHSEEELWPMSAEDFLASSVLLWTHDGPCADWSPGTEEHAEGLGERADLRGRFDRRRLAGPNAYAHAAANRECDEPGPRATAGDHTRPHDPSRTPKGLELDEGFALDLDDDKRKGGGKVEREGPQKVFKKVPVYYERHPDEPQGKRQTERITYWLFYGLSQPPGAKEGTRFVVHEGDWERISVLLAREDEEHFAPISARYHAHDGNRDVAWPAVKRVGTGGSEPPTHPVVFSARGSHASYWRAGSYENLFSVAGRPRFAVHDSAIACPGCPQWRAWEFLLDARVQPWYGFGGAWGQPGGMGGTTGPLGPSSYKTRGKGRSPEDAVRLSPAPIATPTATPKATPTVTPAP